MYGWGSFLGVVATTLIVQLVGMWQINYNITTKNQAYSSLLNLCVHKHVQSGVKSEVWFVLYIRLQCVMVVWSRAVILQNVTINMYKSGMYHRNLRMPKIIPKQQ